MKKRLGNFAVIGDPVEHSLSPKIHNLFAKQHGNQIEYEKIRVTKGLFVAFVENFFLNQGVNGPPSCQLQGFSFFPPL